MSLQAPPPLGISHALFMCRLQDAQISVAMFKMPNMTSIPRKFYEDISYDDCRCSVVPAEKCLKEGYLRDSRVGMLIIFVAQVYLLWEHLWLSGDRIYIFAYAYWITSMLIFLAISVLIHQSNYYYDEITRLLALIGLLLFGSFMLYMISKQL
jgi:hypothetical protein